MTGVEVAAAAKVTVSAITIADRHGVFRRIRLAFKRKRTVLVLGSTGVGKSQFIASLRTLLPEVIDRMNRTERTKSERVELGRYRFLLIDTPGQTGHFGERAIAMRQVIGMKRIWPGWGGNKAFGIVNVVANGYHEYRASATDAVGSDHMARDPWLTAHRDVEISAMLEWAPTLATSADWILTLVNKADLWWPSRDDVRRHYEQGSYHQRLDAYSPKRHVVREYCSVQHRFFNLADMAGSFGQEERTALQQATLHLLVDLTTAS